MSEAYIFGNMDKYRARLLQAAEGCPEDRRNVVPPGFNNSIHWHIGHILTVTERFVFGLSEQNPVLPPSYQSFFGNGTKPADWQETPPSWETVIAGLKNQPARIRESLTGKLNIAVKENYMKAETIGELILGSVLHESNHSGSISAMLKVLK